MPMFFEKVGGGTMYQLDKEVKTGDVWIDGKAIFRKTMNFKNPKNAQVLLTDTEIDSVIDIKGIAKTDTEFLKIPYKYNGNQATINLAYSTSQLKLMSNLTFIEMHLTIYYTKKGA